VNLRASTLLWLALGPSACSVKLLAETNDTSVANTCHASSDCGSGASCQNGVCVASTGTIDEVLVEVIPDSQSDFGGLSFVSTLDGITQGAHDRNIDVAPVQGFVPQVRADLSDYPNCPTDGGKQQLAARVVYTRVSSVGGVPILGLPEVSVTVDLQPSGPTHVLVDSQPATNVSLLPGTYDIYVTPVVDASILATYAGCEVAPFVMRNISVAPDSPPSSPPATIDLPPPVVLDGTVLRKGGTLVGWTLDVVEPQDGLVISTLGPLGATSMNFLTNFNTVTYQPPVVAKTADAPSAGSPTSGSPLIRLTPPPEMLTSAPTVYWDLSAVDINGVASNNHEKVSLEMTGVPIPDQLVDVGGQALGDKVGTRTNLHFFSVSLEGALGITAVFNPSIMTDDQGRYTIKLFPGQYRVVATPDVTVVDVATPTKDSPAATSPWAITEKTPVAIAKTDNAPLTIDLAHKIVLQGTALADPSGAPATGSTFEVVPSILVSKVGVLRSALAQTPALPASASVPIADDKKGAFSLSVDPGDFDLSLRPADTSNFAWWVAAAKHIDTTTATAPLAARLPLPVLVDGTITIETTTATAMSKVPLGNATVHAFAKAPNGAGVTKVGETRTDDAGHYILGLPASFAP
jgi:hypothetical protein